MGGVKASYGPMIPEEFRFLLIHTQGTSDGRHFFLPGETMSLEEAKKARLLYPNMIIMKLVPVEE